MISGDGRCCGPPGRATRPALERHRHRRARASCATILEPGGPASSARAGRWLAAAERCRRSPGAADRARPATRRRPIAPSRSGDGLHTRWCRRAGTRARIEVRAGTICNHRLVRAGGVDDRAARVERRSPVGPAGSYGIVRAASLPQHGRTIERLAGALRSAPAPRPDSGTAPRARDLAPPNRRPGLPPPGGAVPSGVTARSGVTAANRWPGPTEPANRVTPSKDPASQCWSQNGLAARRGWSSRQRDVRHASAGTRDRTSRCHVAQRAPCARDRPVATPPPQRCPPPTCAAPTLRPTNPAPHQPCPPPTLARHQTLRRHQPCAATKPCAATNPCAAPRCGVQLAQPGCGDTAAIRCVGRASGEPERDPEPERSRRARARARMEGRGD